MIDELQKKNDELVEQNTKLNVDLKTTKENMHQLR